LASIQLGTGREAPKEIGGKAEERRSLAVFWKEVSNKRISWCVRAAFSPRVRITLHFSQMNLKYIYENYLAFMNKAKPLVKKFT
jgi:hypothetical protein